MTAPAVDEIITRCANHPERYEYSALPGKRWIERRLIAMQLCAGCPLLGAPCAQRALQQEGWAMAEMVWSGVPIPPPSHIADRRRAYALLREIAGHE